LGTSGTGTQFFHHKGRRYGHILDPRTGWPAEGVLSSTATAPQAASADALATAFYVMGLDQTQRFCQQHPGIGAIVVCAGQQRGTVVVHSFNVDDQHLRLAADDRQAI
jgi:thiamine biosynthesis lipoprotein